ncbi:MAG: heavy metal-binding domain-containing protein [Hydrogenophaga sp.]|uniref:YbjQ family protein n=1 Tax=Hydrogenophaga sp. TaxID=1904254 RepID=UPI00271BE15C|nr:heavy metal-binding domain-containing protein [Hydrogenophaga sp.]MDO9571512.1 heavy metal-binding domain-containing protein [Hydrogenophaga sp.]MDP3374985.1 heavy metal-binding domain-containing protein [Hydrogenophaga sp.]
MQKVKLLKVKSIVKESQADFIGITEGDYVVEYNDTAIRTDEELSNLIRLSKASGRHRQKIGYWHNNKRITRKLTSESIGINCENIELNIDEVILKCRMHRDLSILPQNLITECAESVQLFTTPTISDKEISAELGLVTAECVFGINFFFDLFNSVRDLVGGRSKALESLMKEAKDELLSDIKLKAALIGADAVISIHLSFNELDGGGKNGMLMANAVGTAVQLRK